MTIPFLCLFLAFLLNLLSKVPVAVAQLQRPGGYDNRLPREQQRALQGWGLRALGAHLNQFEAFPAFAAAVIAAHVLGADPWWSSALAVTFVAARLAYNALYIANLDWLRTTSWTVGYAATGALLLLPWL